MKISREEFLSGLDAIALKLKMEVKVRFPSEGQLKRMAVLVTKEPLCLTTLLEAKKCGAIEVKLPLVLSNREDLKEICEKEGLPFFSYEFQNQRDSEAAMLKKLEEYDIDFIVLARYMKILSPDFIWRYENRIINIHPSLLPAFPGAQAYRQAVEKGVKVAGVTAHFVTMDLDQGPIISQDVFKISSSMSVSEVVVKGQELEAKTLLKAVKLYLSGKIDVHWGRVHGV
jgi:formyltetrahydrofolate deformylase